VDTEANKQLARRYWEEVWNQGNLALIPELFGSALVDGERNFISRTLSAFPESVVTIDDMIAEGDKVVVRYQWNAVHRSVWEMELGGISTAVPPTNKQVSITGIAICRVADGKMVENWAVWTALDLAQQLGVIPSPTPTDDQTGAST
jgi:predicted ester cyclase